MSTEKLPEWPDRAQFEPRRLHTCGERWEPAAEREYNRAEYQMRLADAALARMEALVDIVSMMSPSCADMHHDHHDRHTFEEPCPVLARLDALLAACERGTS